jgi:hypothetical protein
MDVADESFTRDLPLYHNLLDRFRTLKVNLVLELVTTKTQFASSYITAGNSTSIADQLANTLSADSKLFANLAIGHSFESELFHEDDIDFGPNSDFIHRQTPSQKGRKYPHRLFLD